MKRITFLIFVAILVCELVAADDVRKYGGTCAIHSTYDEPEYKLRCYNNGVSVYADCNPESSILILGTKKGHDIPDGEAVTVRYKVHFGRSKYDRWYNDEWSSLNGKAATEDAISMSHVLCRLADDDSNGILFSVAGKHAYFDNGKLRNAILDFRMLCMAFYG